MRRTIRRDNPVALFISRSENSPRAESIGIGAHPTIGIYLHFEVRFVVYRPLFQFALNFLPAVFEICGDDMSALQNATRLGTARTSIGSSKLGFRVIKVLIENFPICLDRDTAVPAISDSDAAFLARANVVIGRGEPLIGMLNQGEKSEFFPKCWFEALIKGHPFQEPANLPSRLWKRNPLGCENFPISHVRIDRWVLAEKIKP